LVVPVLRGSTAYLQAIGTDGRVRWEYNSTAGHISSPTFGGDGSMVVVASERCRPRFVVIEYHPPQQYDFPCRATTMRVLKSDRSEAWNYLPNLPATEQGGDIDAPAAITDDGLILVNLNEGDQQGNTFTRLVALNSTISGLASSHYPVLGREPTFTSRARGDTVARRTVNFTGKLRNRFGAGEPLSGQTMTVRTANNEFLCRTTTDQDGRYRCGTQLEDMRSANAMIAVSGAYGTTSQAVVIPVGNPTLSYEIKADLTLDATTLRLQGIVRNARNELMFGATVGLTSPEVAAQNLVTDANGAFDVYLLAPAGKTQLTLELRYQDQTGQAFQRQNFTLIANTLNQANLDLTASNSTAGTIRLSLSLGLSQLGLARGVDGYFYGIDRSNRLLSFDKEGQIRWSRTLGANPTPPSVAPDGTIFVGSEAGLSAINRDGSLRWQRTLPVAGALAVDAQSRVYALSSNRLELQAYAIDGSSRWRYGLPSLATGVPSISETGLVYLGLTDQLISLKVNGDLNWTAPISGVRWLALGASTVYADSVDGRVRALETTGQVRWSYLLNSANAALVLATDETLYAGVVDPASTVQQMVAISQTGSKVAQISTNGSAVPMAVSNNGEVILASSDRSLSGVNQTGQKVWSSTLSASLGTGGLIVDNEAVVVSTDGKLHFVTLNSTGYAASLWARLGRDNQSSQRAGAVVPLQNNRIVRVRGRVFNQFLNSQFMAGVKVVVRDSNNNFVCQTQSDSTGVYGCGGPAGSNANLVIVAQNDDATLSQNVIANGTADTEYTLDFALPITTLELKLMVRDNNANPIANANINITGQRTAQLVSNSLGEVTWLTTAPTGVKSLLLNFEARSGSLVARRSETINLTAGELNQADLELRLFQVELGTMRWQFATGAKISSQPALAADGTIYVTSQDKKLYALRSNGTERWAYTTGGVIMASPVVREDGSIVVASSDNTITTLEANGSRRWVYNASASQAFELTPAVTQDGIVYSISSDGELHAIRQDGQKLWTTSLGIAKTSPVVMSDGAIVVGTANGYLQALNSDGSLRWVSKIFADALALALDAEGQIFVLQSQGKLLRLSKSGLLLSEQTVASAPITSASISISGSALRVTVNGVSMFGNQRFYETNGATLTSKRSDTFATDWSYNAPDAISGISLGADNLAYITSQNGRVYAINIESNRLTDGAWVKFGRDLANTSRQPLIQEARRLVRFQGVISNQFQRSITLAGAEVSLQDGQNAWCRALSATNGQYTCTASINTLEAKTIGFNIQSQFGTNSSSINVPAGLENSLTQISTDGTIPVTTLKLLGTAQDGTGQGLVGATLDILNSNQSLTTGANGSFETYLMFPSSQTNVALQLRLKSGTEEANTTLTYNLTANQLVTVNPVIQLRTPGTQRWSQVLGAAPSALAAGNNRIYLTRGDRLLSYDFTGVQKGVWSVPNASLSAPVLANNLIYVSVVNAGTAYLQTLTQTDLLEPVKTYIPNPITAQLSAPVVATDGTVYGIANQRLIALRPDLTEFWVRSIQANPGNPTLAADGTILLNGEQLEAINPDGSLRWRVAVAGAAKHLAINQTNQVVLTRSVSGGGLILGYDLNGEMLFSHALPAEPSSEPVINTNGQIVLALADQTVRAYGANGQIWTRSVTGTSGGYLSVSNDGQIHLAGSQLAVLSADGAPVWSQAITESAVDSGIVTASGLWFVATQTTTNGTLRAVNTSATAQANTTWSRQFANAGNNRALQPDQISRRLVIISGTVRNQFNANQILKDFKVRFYTGSNLRFCETTTDAQGRFSCGAPSQDMGSHSLNWTTTGELGTATGSMSVPSGNTTTPVTVNMDVPINTLRLSGTVKRGNQTVPNLEVRLSGDATASTRSDSNGQYSFNLMFLPNKTSVSLDLQTQSGDDLASSRINSQLTAASLTTRTQDLEFRVAGAAIWTYDPVETTRGMRLAISSNGALYAGSRIANPSSSLLVAIDESGRLRWQRGTAGENRSTPITLNGLIYSVLQRSTATTLDVIDSTGQNSWSFDLEQGLAEPALKSDGTAYLLTNKGTFFAINNNTLQYRLPQFADAINGYYPAPSVDSNGMIYQAVLRAGQAKLIALNPDGTSYWEYAIPNNTLPSQIALHQDNIYLTAGGVLYSLNSSGTLNWQQTDVALGISLSADVYIYTTNANGLRKLSSNNGAPDWTYSTNQTPQTVPLIGDNGTVYLGDSSGRVYAVSSTGTPVWVFTPPSTDAVTDINLNNKVLYVAYASNKVIAIQTDSSQLANTWARQRFDTANSNAQTQMIAAKRMLRFTGRVALLDGRSASTYELEIKSGNTLYCKTITDTDGRYRCGRQTSDLNAVNATITARGNTDGLARQATAALAIPIGSANQVQEITTDVSIAITSLEVKGILKNPDGSPSANVAVAITGTSSPNGVYFEATVNTNAQGQYRHFFPLPDTSRVAGFTLRAGSSAGSVVKTETANLTALQMTSKTIDLSLQSQTLVRISGKVQRSDSTLSKGAKILLDSQEKTVVDEFGRYEFTLTLDAAQTSLSNTLTAVDAMGSASQRLSRTITPSTLNEISQNLTVDTNSLGRAKLALPNATDFVMANNQYYVAFPDAIAAYSTTWTELWRVNQTAKSPLVVTPDQGVVFISAESKLVKLQASQGNLDWAQTVSATCDACKAVAVAQNGTVYAAIDSQLLEFTGTGTRGFTYNLGGAVLSEPVIAQNGTIYLKVNRIGGGSKLVAVNPNGTRAWEYESTDLASDVNAPVISPTGQIIVELGEVHAVNQNGSMAWKNGFGATTSYIVTPVILPDGRIIISRKEGYSTLILSPNGTVLSNQHGYWWHAENILGDNGIRYQMGAEGSGQSVVAHQLDGSQLWRNGSYYGSGDFGQLGYPIQVLGLTNQGQLITKNLNGLAIINTNSSSTMPFAWAQRGADQARSGRQPANSPQKTFWLSGLVKNTTLPSLIPNGFRLRVKVENQPECITNISETGTYGCSINAGTALTADIQYRIEFQDGTLVSALTKSVSLSTLSVIEQVIDLEVAFIVARVKGKLTDTASEAVPNYQIRSRLSTSNTSINLNSTTNNNGEYQVDQIIKPASYLVRSEVTNPADNSVQFKELTNQVFAANQLTEKTLNLTFASTGTLKVSGVVKEADGTVAAGRYYFGNLGGVNVDGYTDANGAFTLSKVLQPNTYAVSLFVKTADSDYGSWYYITRENFQMPNLLVEAGQVNAYTLDPVL
jgi:hypothetical protein